MKYILPNKDDILYIYVEPWFTGFAPCFDNDLYSLACCMGNVKNGGMKASVCKNIENGKNVWVLSVAGKQIRKTEKNGSKHNCTSIDYAPNDIICLAKVKNTYTWDEYYNEFSRRKDAIYRINNGEIECIDASIHTIENAKRDCALSHESFCNLKQIFTSENYYIFKSGNQLPEGLTKNRGYTYTNNNPEYISELINENNIAFYSKNPFVNIENKNGSCKK